MPRVGRNRHDWLLILPVLFYYPLYSMWELFVKLWWSSDHP